MDKIEELYFALKSDTALTALLAEREKSIRADMTSYAGRYPVLCYQVIYDVPHMWGDDRETARRMTVQISILTASGADRDIVLKVREIMEGLGWARISTDRMMEGKIRVTALRYVIAESEEE